MSIYRKQRSGVVLLIVLSLLVLFVFIGVTFVVLAGVQQDVAKKHAQIELRRDNPERELYEAVMMLTRGTRNKQSALFCHSLLEDLYGTDYYVGPFAPQGVRGVVANSGAASDAGGQFVRLTVSMGGVNTNNSRLAGFYDGCVFTMLTGPAAGLSSRVTQFFPGGAGVDTLMIELPPDAPLSVVSNLAASFNSFTFLINGRPFNGTGAGYNTSTDNLDLSAPGVGQVALNPNYGRYITTAGTPWVNVGGMDESWDAPDYQNMPLAYVPLNATSASEIIPSFHRPSLARYWANNGGTAATAQYYTMRPHAWSPLFNGSNPAFADIAAAGNRWDVDNDGDGVTDSVWIDAGFPVKTDPSGRMYKPLFAYLVVDLDSRINLNAAGNAIERDPLHYVAGSASPAAVSTGGAAAGGAATVTVPRGYGVGPGEISLAPVVGIDSFSIMAGRYFPNAANGEPGIPAINDQLSQIHDLGTPLNYSGGVFGSYGSPPDLRGQVAVFLGPNGQPQYLYAGNNNETVDDPYEINLVRPNGYDTPFSLAEMERLLRWHDADATSLPTRLLASGPNSLGSPVNRRMVTTHSYHIPVPNTQLAPGIRSTALSPAPLAIMANRLRAANGALSDTQISQQLSVMLPWELLHNSPMNLNRPFGNGVDDNNNFVFDEEGIESNDSYFGNTPDYANDDPIQSSLYSRRVYARHLYCMMMFLVDNGYTHPTIGVAPVDQPELTARLIAQWAVNCVDARDSDAIMTPFEYDINPFDGWNVNENIADNDGPHRGLVWGCEHPDLVITETLAFHDVRLADTDAGGKRLDPADDTMALDEELDSVRIPQGSLFVELKSVRRASPSLPRELYTANGLLDLARITSNGSPVWRIVISPPAQNSSALVRSADGTTSFDPLDMDRRVASVEPMGPTAAESIERVIVFTPNAPAILPDRTFYRQLGGTLLTPGNYAVVGPRARTFIGRQRAATAPPAYEIRLNTGGSPQVSSVNSTGATVNGGHAVGGDIQEPLAIICGAQPPAAWSNTNNTAPTGIGLNVSEPLPQSADYYPEPMVQLVGFPTMDSYRDETANDNTNTIDIPLDKQSGVPLESQVPTQMNTGTTLDFKSCFLQRLANPLADYDPVLNPYITVDWAAIDLTVFNGEDEEPGAWAATFPWNPDDPDPYGSDPEERFGSRQRGSGSNPASFWSPLTNAPAESNANATPADLFFNHEMQQTLGYLNDTLGAPIAGGPFLGEPAAGPVPWISILDRPYASPYELLLVPASEPGRLTLEFSTQTGSPYGTSNTPAEFNHLLNFFSSNSSTGSGSNFYRIFDFVEVPSRFVGTRTVYNASHFNDSIAGTNYLSTPTAATLSQYSGYRTPFNYSSRFREPGRVNINTIPNDGLAIWQAICRLPAAEANAQWNAIVASRQGVSLDMGTRYAGVFQSAASADMAPLSGLQRSAVQAGLLRETTPGSTVPLLARTSTQQYDNTSQHAYFRYQDINRVSNLVTTHSNVYAVWITVGYFAVNPQDPTQIMYEIGSDTGEIERHRAFYIVDRSIPVAFEPGENHNVRKCIVLERFLE